MKHLLITLILLLCTLTVFAQKEKVMGPKKKPQTTVTTKPKQQASQTKQPKQQASSKQKPVVKPKQSSKRALVGSENGHEWVDLGLSVKWATMNVGASSATDYGDYFAWGETRTKSTYSWDTYFDTNDGGESFFKYALDKKTSLDLSDDAAHVNWGGSWRMPTDSELRHLSFYCTWTLTTQNGVIGYKVSSNSNGNSIFLPAAGSRYGGDSDVGSYGDYWSSSLGSHFSGQACYYSFESGKLYESKHVRYYGRSVRAVCP